MNPLPKKSQLLTLESDVWILALAAALLYFAGGLVVAFVMVWLYKLGASFIQVGLVSAFYDLALALSFLAGGRLSERYRGRTIFVLGLVCSLVSAILYGLAGFLLVWIPVALGLVLGKVAIGLRETSSFSIVSQVACEGRKATSFGFVYTLQQLGYVVGPIVGGVMIIYYGWGSPFFATIPIISVAILLILMKLNAGRVTSSQVSFSLSEFRRAMTMDRGILVLTMIAVWSQFFEEFSNPFFTIFLEETFHAPPYMLGFCFTAMSVATLLFSIPGGLSTDATGRRKPLIIVGAIMMTASFGLVAFALNPMMFVASYFLAGISFAITNTAIPSYFADVSSQGVSTAYGIRLAMMYLVGMFAPPIAGWIIQTYHSIRLPFTISLVGCVIEIGLIAFFFNETKRNRKPKLQ